MTTEITRTPPFNIKAAMGQVFNLPGGNGYLFRVLGWGTLILLIGFLLFGVPIAKAYISMFQNIIALDTSSAGGEPDPAEVWAVIGPFFASFGLFMLLYIVQVGTYISVEAALYRNIIRGEDRGIFPLWFGYDEWRVLGTKIVVGMILYAIFMGVYFAMAILLGIIFGIGGAISSSGVVAVIGGLIFFIAFLGLLAGMAYASIRFIPAAAISVRDEEFSPFSAWNMMKPYALPTLGAVVIVGLIGYFALAFFTMLALGILVYSSGMVDILTSIDWEAETMPDLSPLWETMSSAGFMIPAVLLMAVSTFLTLLYMGAIWSIWGYIAKLTHWRNW